MNAQELLGALGVDPDEMRPAHLPIPEAQVATLREVYERYANGCQFKPGDLVTPRNNYSLRGAGLPHVVLEVRTPGEAVRTFDAPDPMDTSSQRYGARLDIRVASFHDQGGQVGAWWGESWQYEPYTGAPQGRA